MAGGEGTRLRPLTANQPKPMLPMANAPMAEHVVNLLRRHGFEEIVVTVGFLASTIRTYFGDGSELGVRLVYATEETPLGTAGSVLNAIDELDDRFLVISGDVVTDVDLTALVEFHAKQACGRDSCAGGRGEPPRVRHRHPRRRRAHRAPPREAGLGRCFQRHDQHRHLRARAGGLRLDTRPAGPSISPPKCSQRCSKQVGRSTAMWQAATGRTSARWRPTCGRMRTSSTARSRSTCLAFRFARTCGSAQVRRSIPRRAWSALR